MKVASQWSNFMTSLRKVETNLKQKLRLIKLKWFKENIDATKDVYTAAEVKELVDKYLNRFEGEMIKEEIPKSLKRHPSSSTFQDYKSTFIIEKEKQDFEIGKLEIPDLMQKKTYGVFKSWNGDIQLLPALETVNISRKQLEKSKNQTQSTTTQAT